MQAIILRSSQSRLVAITTILVVSWFCGCAPKLSPPSFAIKLEQQSLVEYNSANYEYQGNNSWRMVDAEISAQITYEGSYQWRLNMTTRSKNAEEVWFPYDIEPKPLNDNSNDDIVYYPHRTGFAYKNCIANTGEWLPDVSQTFKPYPGSCFSPLVVLADHHKARMVAASNWPPKPVTPLWAFQKLTLKYVQEIPPGQTEIFHALIYETTGNAALGQYPWQLAVDPYKDWLKKQMQAEGLYPVPYPVWLKQVNGFLHVNLHKAKEFDAGTLTFLQEKWKNWRKDFPWIQFWGQMSDNTDTSKNCNEGGECCELNRIVHLRYVDAGLLDFVKQVTQDGDRAGYYQRPLRWPENKPYFRLDDLTTNIDYPFNDGKGTALEFIREWIMRNKESFGANAFYLDGVGAVFLGDPMFVVNLFKPNTPHFTFPEGSVIEWPVDIYPAAYLMGGSLWGGKIGRGGPGLTPENVCTGVAFARFGRYVLGDRIFFSGVSNGDYYFWGPETGTFNFWGCGLDINRACSKDWVDDYAYVCEPYWTERQTFLLGAKFDIESPEINPNKPDEMNPIVRAALEQWAAVDWWNREPEYLDTKGITDVPNHIDVRRFIDKNGVKLFAIDNPDESDMISFSFDGNPVTVQISIDKNTGKPYALYIFEKNN